MICLRKSLGILKDLTVNITSRGVSIVTSVRMGNWCNDVIVVSWLSRVSQS